MNGILFSSSVEYLVKNKETGLGVGVDGDRQSVPVSLIFISFSIKL